MDFLVTPWQHQKLAIERAKSLDYFALFFEQGTGKTSTLINILRQKFPDDQHPLRTLILCPPIVIENWKRELLKYSRIPEGKIITLCGSGLRRLNQTNSLQDAIYITNYQSVLMDTLYKRLSGFKVVVLDESHKIKTYNSKTTKRVLKLGEQAQYRYCLSGTPVLNTASDIFPQIQFLDQGERLGDNFFKFRQEYFHDFNQGMPRHVYFPNWKMKPDTTSRINKVIEPISARVLKKDCLDLPPLVRQRIDCPLTDEQADVYRSLESDFVSSLGSGRIITEMELTKGLRLQQIVSGYCPNDEGVIHEFKPNPRLAVLSELLEGLCQDHKVIIWAVFKENFRRIELLLSALGIPFVSVYGGVASHEQRARCNEFESHDRIRVLLGHPKSCGVGVNLTAADYAIFFSRGFSLEDDLQAEARNHRGGSERHESVVRIDLVTAGTIDEVILEALASKQSLSDAILEHIKLQKENQCYRPKLANRVKI